MMHADLQGFPDRIIIRFQNEFSAPKHWLIIDPYQIDKLHRNMKEEFEKIENWLKENAEKIFELSLQKPATQDEIGKDGQIDRLISE